MDSGTAKSYGGTFTAVVLAVAIAALMAYLGMLWYSGCKSAASYEAFQAEAQVQAPPPSSNRLATIAGEILSNPTSTMAEGFWAGPTKGAGAPDCLRVSSEAAALYDLFASKQQLTEEGPDDLRELKLILSKVSCLKQDLVGVAQVVNATRHQPFSTAHDMEPVAETAARCFAKTIPQRDLELSLEKWGSRGTFLIKRLCTSVGLTADEEEQAIEGFSELMSDIRQIALGACCNGPAMIAGKVGPRMVGGYEPSGLTYLRDYNGYY